MPEHSGKLLVQKLGIQAGHSVLVVSGPKDYESLIQPIPQGVTLRRSGKGPFDVIHVFSTRGRALEADLLRLSAMMSDEGMIWASWPRRSSGVATDLDDSAVRGIALRVGLVDVKVCAIDETWSGLKLVRRLTDRRSSSRHPRR
jgi:hypothetical protein